MNEGGCMLGPLFSTEELAKYKVQIFKKYLPIIKSLKNKSPKINEWDIPYTINELAYLTHGHYRYYGKFPSVIAGQILEQFPPTSKDSYVLDNFCGSGTTLVESKIRGINSFGIDISWLSVLVSNVKCAEINIKEVKDKLTQIVDRFYFLYKSFDFKSDDFLKKWFTQEASRDLSILQNILFDLPLGNVRDFLIVAFLAIVRRVSKAYDGEVRPHINKTKKSRNVLSAFSKKVMDMCKNHKTFLDICPKNVKSRCFLGNNLSLPIEFYDSNCYLVVSHPPYLNSFNYSPVYSLEFYWGSVFEKQYVCNDEQLYRSELRAHPATDNIVNKYFNHLKVCYEETFKIQKAGGYLAIVIGDCTRNKKLIPVVAKTIELVSGIGYKLHEINYRTTHYGLGKYAYRHRADYHGEVADKKDGIIIFKK